MTNLVRDASPRMSGELEVASACVDFQAHRSAARRAQRPVAPEPGDPACRRPCGSLVAVSVHRFVAAQLARRSPTVTTCGTKTGLPFLGVVTVLFETDDDRRQERRMS